MHGEQAFRLFEEFVRNEQFPCVGAKSALARDALTVIGASDIRRTTNDLDIHRALSEFGAGLDIESPVVSSFAVVFDGPEELSEEEFEAALWDRVQALHNLDVATGTPWNDDVDDDPNSPHFSLSLAGEAYFVIGLHPRSSRPARRFPRPALVFNSHAQFEKLRRDGRYDRMKDIIRQRDVALAGDTNPMLADFGRASEARQYSGRAVDREWQCPFEHKDVHDSNERIEPRSGTAFRLPEGATLTVVDPMGEQVSDLVAFNASDPLEHISSGRSIDYASRMFLTARDILYSNRSRPMLTIVEDEVGRHDFTLTPCSRDTFRIIYGEKNPGGGCQENLSARSLLTDGPDDIPIAFNVFMHVAVNETTGEISVLPPKSKAGQKTCFARRWT